MKLYLILFIPILLIGCVSVNKKCPIKDASGRCQSEIEVYRNSLSEGSDLMPLLTREIRGNDPIYNDNTLSNRAHKTWIAEHSDANQMRIGGHYIYWGLPDENSRRLEPAK